MQQLVNSRQLRPLDESKTPDPFDRSLDSSKRPDPFVRSPSNAILAPPVQRLVNTSQFRPSDSSKSPGTLDCLQAFVLQNNGVEQLFRLSLDSIKTIHWLACGASSANVLAINNNDRIE